MTFLFTLLAALALAAGPTSHPDSRSSSRVSVRGDRAELELVAQARTVLETLPLDLDGDGALSAGELEAGREAFAAYVLARYQLFPSRAAGLEAPFDPALALVGRPTELRLLDAALSAQGEPLLSARFVFEVTAPIAELTLRVRVFREQNPFHRDEARLEFQDDLPARHLFAGVQGEVWRYATEGERRPGVFADYWREGVRHIAAGFDHLAFLLALVLAARRPASLLVVVTAFTLAHTLTLGLAAFELVRVRSDLVEMAIALSIAYVGALNLLPKSPPSRWLEAFVFGLVHGLGFAGAIRDSLAFEPLRLTALLGFNLGVECGQVAIVLPVALLLVLLGRPIRRGRPGRPDPRAAAGEDDQAWLAPRRLRVSGSIAVVLAGLAWFVQRTGLLR